MTLTILKNVISLTYDIDNVNRQRPRAPYDQPRYLQAVSLSARVWIVYLFIRLFHIYCIIIP